MISLFIQVMSILPPALLLLALLDAWIPRHAISEHLGESAGMRGWFIAIFLGSFAAGPLFTAFPLGAGLATKGARTANIVIFLGSWATIKLPMLLLESRFLGLRFSLLRLALTLPALIVMGIVVERLAPPLPRRS